VPAEQRAADARADEDERDARGRLRQALEHLRARGEVDPPQRPEGRRRLQDHRLEEQGDGERADRPRHPGPEQVLEDRGEEDEREADDHGADELEPQRRADDGAQVAALRRALGDEARGGGGEPEVGDHQADGADAQREREAAVVLGTERADEVERQDEREARRGDLREQPEEGVRDDPAALHPRLRRAGFRRVVV
jgi:hypothetical protein